MAKSVMRVFWLLSLLAVLGCRSTFLESEGERSVRVELLTENPNAFVVFDSTPCSPLSREATVRLNGDLPQSDPRTFSDEAGCGESGGFGTGRFGWGAIEETNLLSVTNGQTGLTIVFDDTGQVEVCDFDVCDVTQAF